MQRKSAGNLLILLLLVGIGVMGRLMPHAPNFTPVAACALFAGFFFRSRTIGIAIPLVTMVISDAFIGGYEFRIMLSVYGSMVFPIVFYPFLARRLTPLRVGLTSVTSSIFFFVTTNFAVYAFGTMYDHSLLGLVNCYVAALPFFKYTLSGDLCWSAAIFGSYALAMHLVRHASSIRISIIGPDGDSDCWRRGIARPS
jgi:hypothetical protein